MTCAERAELYEQIEIERGRPLITYITSSRSNAEGIIASDVIPEFCRQILKIPQDVKEIDLLVVSRGGDPIVSWRIISLLRERFDRISVLVPYEAFSAATLLALGADEIVMHPFSNLGPVDPQLQIMKNIEGRNEHVHFAAEDLAHFLDFVGKDVGITDQEQKERAFELIAKEVGSIPIGAAKRSSNLALSLGEKLLGLHMDDPNKVKTISEALNKSFYHHGYPVGRKEAKVIGLNVVDPPAELGSLMWQVWEDMEEEMKCREPFTPIDVVMNDPRLSQAIHQVQQLPLPANTPPQLLLQIFQQHFQQIELVSVPPVNCELLQAAVESLRLRSEFRSVRMISAVRSPDLNININVAPIQSGWKTIPP
ncbi:MAG: SDH family Clp fold serine proteinase [Methanomicrobiales archaeon]